MMSEESESLVRIVCMTMALFLVMGACMLIYSTSRDMIMESTQNLKEVSDTATTEVADTTAEENTLNEQISEIVEEADANQAVAATEVTEDTTTFSESFKSLICTVGDIIHLPACIIAIIACSVSVGFGGLYLYGLHKINIMYVEDRVITNIVSQTRNWGDIGLYAFAVTMVAIALIFL